MCWIVPGKRWQLRGMCATGGTIGTGAFLAVLLVLWHVPPPARARAFREVLAPFAILWHGKPEKVCTGPAWDGSLEATASREGLQHAFEISMPSSTVQILEFANPILRQGCRAFAYQDPSDPRLARLREVLELDDAIAGSRGDVERFHLLTSHIRGLAEHTESSEGKQYGYQDRQDAFSILAAVKNGATLQCQAYSLLLIQTLAAMGHVARMVASGYDAVAQHASVEIWSNELCKWILFDPDFDLSFEQDGMVLSAFEVHTVAATLESQYRRWLFSVGGTESSHPLRGFVQTHGELLGGITVVRGTARSERIERKLARSPTRLNLELYRSFSIAMRNDYLSVDYPPGHPVRSKELAIQNACARWLEAYDGLLTNQIEDLYWTLNVARLGFVGEAKGGIRVTLGTLMPGFKGFRIQVNGRSAKESTESSFTWQPESGEQTLEVTPVGLDGREGIKSRVKLVIK